MGEDTTAGGGRAYGDVALPGRGPLGGDFLTASTEPNGVFTVEDLNDEQRLIGRLAHDFAVQEVGPLLEELEAGRHQHSLTLLRRAGELGLLSLEVPAEYGGLAVDQVTAMLVAENMAPAGSFSVTINGHTGIGTLPIVYYGTRAQKDRYLPKLATGEWSAAYALTEPDAGTDARGIRTRAVLSPDGRHYILNGQKQWITNSGFAHIFIVYAKVDGEHITAFIVERDFPGVSLSDEVAKMGLKGSSTRALYLQDVPVPVDNVLGQVGKGHHVAFNILNIGRLKLAAGCLGASKRLLGIATRYAEGRRQFGQPLAAFSLIQQKLATMAARIYALEATVYRTAGAFDASLAASGLPGPDAGPQAMAAIAEYAVEASINKVFGSETLDYVVDEALQIHGGYGYMQGYEVERAYRDARIYRIFEGTNEINRLVIPRTLLRRIRQGRLPFPEGLAAPAQPPSQPQPAVAAGSQRTGPDPLARERALVDGIRRVAAMVAALVWQRPPQQLDQDQELQAAIADLCIELYAAESSVLRAVKAGGQGLHADLARLWVAASVPRVGQIASYVLPSLLAGDALRAHWDQVHRWLAAEPVDAIALGRKVAAAVREAEGYPLSAL